MMQDSLTATYLMAEKASENIMQKKLFWVAVLYHDKKKTKVVIGPHHRLAKSEDTARKAAIKEIDAVWKERFDRLEVIVRPF